MKEDLGGPDVLVTDVTCLKWPKELSLTMEEKLIGGSNTVVFMLKLKKMKVDFFNCYVPIVSLGP